MFGLLNLNKPAGMTSRGAVNWVQRLVPPHKVGHAGTLDPIATGVLVVCVGQATRLIEHVQRMPKRYRGEFCLGVSSPTDDIESDPTPLEGAAQPTRAELEAAVEKFRGTIEQRPPAYSAVKVAGRRAYELARRGKQLELAPRSVTIHQLEIVSYDHPQLVLDVACSQGTYIRALGRDLAQAVGTAAVMSGLVRTAIGPFTLEKATAVETLTRETLAAALLPPLTAVADLPRVQLSPDELALLANGRSIELTVATEAAELAVVDAEDHLLALLVPRGDALWGPSHNFAN